MEILARRAGLQLVHIPNKAGASGMLNDLVSGDAQVAFLNVATPASMIRAGQLRPLAVITEKRMPDYPDVPTLAELGFPGIGTVQWLAIRSEEHTSELQSLRHLVCRLLLEKK